LDKLRRFLVFYFKFVPPFFAISLPLVALYGVLQRWPAADDILRRHADQTPVMVGFANKWSRLQVSGDADRTTSTSRSRQYIFLPSFLTRPTVTTVAQHNADQPTVSESTPAQGVGALATYVLCLLMTWFVWLRPRKRPASGQAPA
jgi:hypothetical protein